MARHLHEQSGGNPRDQGPVPELANEPTSPRADDDFPDAPDDDRRSGPGGDLTDDQLDDFAARLGLTDDETADDETGDESGAATSDETGDTGPETERFDDTTDDQDRRPVMAVVTRRIRWAARPVGRVMIVSARVVDGTGRWLRTTGERFVASGPRRR